MPIQAAEIASSAARYYIEGVYSFFRKTNLIDILPVRSG